MAENRYATANEILADAQDLDVLVRSTSNPKMHTYAVKPSLKAQRQLYKESVANRAERKIPAFQKHWQFDEEEGITGSSTYLTLRFDKALRRRGLRIPSLLEAKALEAKGKLESGVYRDYGICVYSAKEPNKEVAERITAQAKKLKLKLPLIVPFSALDYQLAEENIVISLISPAHEGIISGNKAVEEIKKLDCKEDSGVHGLGRYADGVWDAYWNDLADSYVDGRVDWVCGEATAKNLKMAHEALLKREYNREKRKNSEEFEALFKRYGQRMRERHEEFKKSLSRKL